MSFCVPHWLLDMLCWLMECKYSVHFSFTGSYPNQGGRLTEHGNGHGWQLLEATGINWKHHCSLSKASGLLVLLCRPALGGHIQSGEKIGIIVNSKISKLIWWWWEKELMLILAFCNTVNSIALEGLFFLISWKLFSLNCKCFHWHSHIPSMTAIIFSTNPNMWYIFKYAIYF